MNSELEELMPSDPLMAQGWVDCLHWAAKDPEAVACFCRDTGVSVKNVTPDDGELGVAFARWYHKNLWGEDEAAAPESAEGGR